MSKIYFGHPINTYDTELERSLVEAIEAAFPDWEVLNPNQPEHQEACQRYRRETGNGMTYFLQEMLPPCSAGVFLPFRDGKFGAGVCAEADFLASRGCPIFEVSAEGRVTPLVLDSARALSVEETRARIRDAHGARIPF
ncbi:MAG: hypothetical protein PHT12_03535 [Patescibacteria group bacterium]|nr:hypothetical protein [Patescibacteria group bacterium]